MDRKEKKKKIEMKKISGIERIYLLIGSKIFWAIMISILSLIFATLLSPDMIEELRRIYTIIMTNVLTALIVYTIFKISQIKDERRK